MSIYCTYRAEVVTLQFSHERRDRRKREYVMIELNHEAIIEILAPISEENQKAFSLASKVEVGTCKSKSISLTITQVAINTLQLAPC